MAAVDEINNPGNGSMVFVKAHQACDIWYKHLMNY